VTDYNFGQSKVIKYHSCFPPARGSDPVQLISMVEASVHLNETEKLRIWPVLILETSILMREVLNSI